MRSLKWVIPTWVSILVLGCGDDGSSSSMGEGDAATSASDDSDGTTEQATTDEQGTEGDTSDDSITDDGRTDTELGGPQDAGSEQATDEPTPDDDAGAPVTGAPDGGVPSGESDASEPRPSVSFSEFCDGVRSAWLAACEAEMRPDCADVDAQPGAQRCSSLEVAIDEGRYAFDGEAAAECMSRYAEDLADVWAYAWLPADDCSVVFTSAALIGDDCYRDETFNAPCGEGYCSTQEGCPGTCVAFAEIGESCTSTRCVENAYCDTSQDACVAQVGVGEACPHTGGCELGLECEDNLCKPSVGLGQACGAEAVCDYPLACKDGSCVERVGEGERCTTGLQCAPELQCHQPLGTEQPVCAPLPEAGDPCALAGAGCAGVDVYCTDVGDPEIGECRSPYVGEGEPCGEDIACEEPFYCRRLEEDSTQGTCVADLEQDGICTDSVNQWLFNNPCVDGLHCMWGATDSCLPPGQLGEPCFYNNPDSCAQQDTYCSLFTGECELPVGLGERCNLAFPERSCTEGLCELVPAEDCDTAPLGDCQDMVCRAPRANGADCDYSEQCSSGYCAFEEVGGTCQEPVTGPQLCLPAD